MPQTKFIMERT